MWRSLLRHQTKCGLELAALVLEEGVVAAAGEGDDVEAAGELADDVERLAADRAGGAEDGDAVWRLRSSRSQYHSDSGVRAA